MSEGGTVEERLERIERKIEWGQKMLWALALKANIQVTKSDHGPWVDLAKLPKGGDAAEKQGG